jgi:hypothetical protein
MTKSKSNYSIRATQHKGNGTFTCTIRDRERKVVRVSPGFATRKEARDNANRYIEHLEDPSLLPPARVLELSDEAYFKLSHLSSSCAKTLIEQSPLHAWTEHPAFGGLGQTPTRTMDRGSVLHTLVLGAGKKLEVLDFDSFRTNDAKEARDAARAAGKVPVLREDYEAAQLTALQIIAGLAARGINLDGHSELAVEWFEYSDSGVVACKGMMDHVHFDRARILDLKIVSSADTDSCEKASERFGYAIQAAAYTRALTRLRPELAGRVDVLFAFCEAEPPYGMNVMRGDGSFRELGERRWMRAVESWGACLKNNAFPGYGDGINLLSPPAWALAKELAA